jgi:putative PIN family toxin of toxin-antitoxin system
VRAVLDPNVLISAVLSPKGKPAQLLGAWREGAFELMVSAALLEELARALRYPKVRKFVEAEDADEFVTLLETSATLVADPTDPPAVRSRESGGNYLLALAEHEGAALVTGDDDLLRSAYAVLSPAAFFRLLDPSA